ncbi:Uma2 family endonuclease [Roseofilum sp. Guam]|uniref:Uma2 family endonuclease n=1 Tax=Roseofilum sp. Guam TaxID=2821502 RepID=UPI001B07D271|nr:Uma2 family endonuclease [Roseofilum sp. Guam]MBP0028602.1 Uma2 family endonuclease [Roseofilum sp. Guam]
MSVQLIDEQQPQTETLEEEVIPLPPTDLPYDDGEPLESNRHRIGMNVLISSLHQAYQGRNDYYSSGNMFVYYSSAQVKNKDFRGPDFFVVLNVDGTLERRSWIVWEEKGRYPDVIVELMSPSTAQQDLNEKKRLYEQTFKTSDYFVYNPFDSNSLQGWRLGVNRKYEEISPNQYGWLWCASLGLWVGTWQGELMKENAPWLRFYDPEDNLILLPEELALLEQERANQAESERDRERERANLAETLVEEQNQKIQQLREHLQQLGINPDDLT